MKSGKISSKGFKTLFKSRFGFNAKEQLLKPEFGKDVSLISIGDVLALASASDPLSFIKELGAKKSAELSVYLVANDIATTGVMPQYFQLVLNLNEDFSEQDFESYWEHLHAICNQLKISIVGGHTGAIPAQNSTIIGGGTMFAVADKKDFIFCNAAKEDDVLLMSKKAGISSTAILGLFFKETAKTVIGKKSEQYFEDLFSDISVLKEGEFAGILNKKHKEKPIHAMHDVTEGGILGAVYEMCEANQLGVEVFEKEILVDKEQRLICEKFKLNPLEIIGAGSMLMAVSPKYFNEVLDFYKGQNLNLTPIGTFCNAQEGKQIHTISGEKKEIHFIEKDPYWEVFFMAYQKGWK